jgi:hypothetical protein
MEVRILKAIQRNKFLLTHDHHMAIPWVPKSSVIPDRRAGVRSLIRKIAGGDARREATQTFGSGEVLFVPGIITKKQPQNFRIIDYSAVSRKRICALTGHKLSILLFVRKVLIH